jgi:aconitate hydratase
MEKDQENSTAMEPRFLGVETVLVKSFARITETNLKKAKVL